MDKFGTSHQKIVYDNHSRFYGGLQGGFKLRMVLPS